MTSGSRDTDDYHFGLHLDLPRHADLYPERGY